MASSLITTYLGSGLLADRPATPSLPSGGLAVYYATDTALAYVYDSSWHTIGPVTSVFGRTGTVTSAASDYDADQIDYDNSSSGLVATNSQDALDELKTEIDGIATSSNWWFSPPVVSDFGTTVLGTGTSLTATDDSDVGLLINGGTYITADKTRAIFKALPAATSFSVKTRLSYTGLFSNFAHIALILRNSGNSKLLGARYAVSSSGASVSGVNHTNENGGITNLTSIGAVGGAPVFLRIDYDQPTSTYSLYYSNNGKQWLLILTQTIATFLGSEADQIGLGITTNLTDAARNIFMSCDYWEQSF